MSDGTEAPSFANPAALAELSIQVVRRLRITDMTQIHEIIRVASRWQTSDFISIDNYVNGMSEGSQRTGSAKDKVYKRPVSILVVIYAEDTKRVLMLQRRDDPDLAVKPAAWSRLLAPGAAMREVKEEVTMMLSLNN